MLVWIINDQSLRIKCCQCKCAAMYKPSGNVLQEICKTITRIPLSNADYHHSVHSPNTGSICNLRSISNWFIIIEPSVFQMSTIFSPIKFSSSSIQSSLSLHDTPFTKELFLVREPIAYQKNVRLIDRVVDCYRPPTRPTLLLFITRWGVS